MSVWDSVMLARRPDRPRPPAFVHRLFTDIVELAGDRLSFDDRAIFAGLARLNGQSVAFIAQRHEAVDTGAAGLRKAVRVLALAERFGLPVVTFTDVAGNHPTDAPHGPMWPAVGAAFEAFMRADTATVGILCGEGVSGGALALCVTDRLIALEHAFLAPTAPEAVSAIIHRDPSRAAEVAETLRMSSAELLASGLCTRVVPEGQGAHIDTDAVMERTAVALASELGLAVSLSPVERLERRVARFRAEAVA